MSRRNLIAPVHGYAKSWGEMTGGGGGYQPLDSDLTAIAALATTAYGRGLLTQANATAVRTYIQATNIASVFRMMGA